MSSPLKTLVQEYGWIHTGLGLLGNVAFSLGVLFSFPFSKNGRPLVPNGRRSGSGSSYLALSSCWSEPQAISWSRFTKLSRNGGHNAF